MARIRFGVIGVGGMGRAHIGNITKMNNAKLTAVCDLVETRAAGPAQEHGCKPFLDYRDLLDSGLVDAVLIATPHYAHPEIAIHAFKRGIHVISEKPLGVTLTPVDAMIRAAKDSGCQFAVMFQQRTRGINQKARQLIQSGAIGTLQRVHFVVPCYRSQAYYNSDAWRATWADEGGGVLVNQAPHFTDQLWWLVGQAPCSVLGKVRTKLHKIEVEDEAEAILDYANGATGYYYTCTTEHPARSFTRFVGDKGVLDLNGTLKLGTLKMPLTKFETVNKKVWGMPEVAWKDVPFKQTKEVGHRGIVENFIKAVNRGTKLISPGAEGIHQVEISCAILLSSMKGKPVSLPVDRKEYDRLMAKLIRESNAKTGKRPAAQKQTVKVFS